MSSGRGSQTFQRTRLPPSSGFTMIWKQRIPPRWWYLPTRLHGVTILECRRYVTYVGRKWGCKGDWRRVVKGSGKPCTVRGRYRIALIYGYAVSSAGTSAMKPGQCVPRQSRYPANVVDVVVTQKGTVFVFTSLNTSVAVVSEARSVRYWSLIIRHRNCTFIFVSTVVQVITQAVTRWFLTAKARVRSHLMSWMFPVGEVTSEQIFFPLSLFGFPY
jgi:hypothetical protein